MKKKIKILFLGAEPTDSSPVRLGEEIREIGQKIRLSLHRDAFDLRSELAVRPGDLQEALLKHQPHIVHFSGHSNRRGILLEDDSGKMKLVKKEKLAEMFSLLHDNIRIVVLNACYSRFQIEAFTTTIDFTIGMNKKIGNRAAKAFAAAFYGRLAYGRSVQNAFELAKNDVALQGIRYPGEPELLSKEGSDPEKAYLVDKTRDRKPQKKTEDRYANLSELDAVLEKVLSGTVNIEERQQLQHAVISGRLVFTNEDRNPTTETGHPQPIIKSYRHQVNIEISPSDYESLQRVLFPKPKGVAPPFPSLIFIGREDALSDVKQMIGVTKKSAKRGTVTKVRGWPGVGKTTLVGVLGRDTITQEAFPDGVLWTSLGQKPDLLSEVAKWGRALGMDELLRVPTQDEATEQLRLLLQRKRMLLIADDVWDPRDAYPFIKACSETCALLITTREHLNVAAALDAFHPAVYLLPVLPEDDGVKLLRILAPQVVEQNADQCRELVNVLECLPLALHVAGSLLKREANMGWGIED